MSVMHMVQTTPNTCRTTRRSYYLLVSFTEVKCPFKFLHVLLAPLTSQMCVRDVSNSFAHSQ